MKSFAVSAFALLLLAAPAAVAAQEAVFVVRHAERADTSADSVLSPAGEFRAQRLGAMLRDAGITRIYTTNVRRTVQTAAPLAAALRLTPTERLESMQRALAFVDAARQRHGSRPTGAD